MPLKTKNNIENNPIAWIVKRRFRQNSDSQSEPGIEMRSRSTKGVAIRRSVDFDRAGNTLRPRRGNDHARLGRLTTRVDTLDTEESL
jgi:hypothetical protein